MASRDLQERLELARLEILLAGRQGDSMLPDRHAPAFLGLVVHGFHVPAHVRGVSEAAWTQQTANRSHTLVDAPLMAPQITLCSERFAAVGSVTREWLLPRMRAHMILQITLLSKCFAAVGNVAYEWSLDSMCAHMTLQVSTLTGAVAAAFNSTGIVSFAMHTLLVVSANLERLESLTAHVAAEPPKDHSKTLRIHKVNVFSLTALIRLSHSNICIARSNLI